MQGGTNWFDTAEIYGLGRSEQTLAQALQANTIQKGEVVVATKWQPMLRTAGNLRKTIDTRLRFLGGYPIDLFYVHMPWGLSGPEAEMDAMADLVEAGKIRAVGVSNFDAGRMQRAHAALEKRGLPLAANQMEYSLLNRKIETNGVLETARKLGVTIVAYTPLAYGLLSGKYHQNPQLVEKKPFMQRRRVQRQVERSRPVVEALMEIAARRGVTPAQAALNWVITSQGEGVVAIPGATSTRQAAENAAAMHFQLAEEELAQLDRLSRPLSGL
jgi:aryl-alcohol dehydrogenase-like predicted oxidoreductase